MMFRRCVAAVAAVAGCVLGVAAPGAAAVASRGAGRVVPRGLVPVATSWPGPWRGIVLGYRSRSAGARPSLLVTGDGGRSWRPLPAPPVGYPADKDQPDAAWAGGVIAVTDGTRVVATGDAGARWAAERLAGAPAGAYVDHLAVARGRVFALVTTAGNTAAGVYSGPARGGVLRPVPGLSITGPTAYGDLTAAGAVQVDLGAGFAAERYWYSRDGAHFTAAPLPCPAATMTLLGGARPGRVTALCAGPPSDVAPGINDKQVQAANRLGGTYRPAGPVFISPNQEQFAAASAQAMTVATIFTLAVTTNADRTWAAALTQGNGATWTDLSFPSPTTGAVLCTTTNNAGQPTATIYRTTNAGRTWHPLTLP